MIEVARKRQKPFSRHLQNSSKYLHNQLIYIFFYFLRLLYLSLKMTYQYSKVAQRSYLQFEIIHVRIY